MSDKSLRFDFVDGKARTILECPKCTSWHVQCASWGDKNVVICRQCGATFEVDEHGNRFLIEKKWQDDDNERQVK